ncbi:MAG TPA: S8 family serine peptidase [Humisphaera sp.]|jgi:hypothetical protein|nr:S8 family serine peptidase [Humisphaera sp.]
MQLLTLSARAVGEAFCEDSLVWTRDSVIAGQQGNAQRTSRPSGCELLEARTFLSASATQVTPATLSHVSSDLVEQYQQYAAFTHTKAAKHGAAFKPTLDPSIAMKGRNVGIIVHPASGFYSSVLRQLRALGVKIASTHTQYNDITGFTPVSALAKIGKIKGIGSVTPMVKPTVHTSGIVPNQADQAMQVQLARNLYGLTGAGVKIGVISDSVAVNDPHGLIAGEQSGELPPTVQIIQDGFSGSDIDEGRALLEVIHDLAPQSPLAFATGDDDVVNMALNIHRLLAAGCKVIVDDLSYEYEPMFQDGLISDAINDVVAAGATYVSAVGNDGTGGYQRTAQYVNDIGVRPDGTTGTVQFVNFAPQGQPADEFLKFDVTNFGDLVFEWDNPWDGSTGVVSSDMDLFFYDQNNNFLFSQTDINSNDDGTGQPVEIAFGMLPGTYKMRVRLTSVDAGAQAPTMYRMVLATGVATGLTNFDYPGQIGSAYGHSAGPNTISVGAVSASSGLTTSEPFSSSGPATYLFDSHGNRLATPQVIQAPVVSGVDHVTTSFFSSSSPGPNGSFYFNGTSAAAPNVAAVAALLYQYEPWATPSQIRSALKNGASPLNGAAPGAWDPQGGFGLVNAAKAISYFDDTPPVAQLAPILPTDGSAPNSAVISFSEPVFGLTLGDLSLTLNGGSNLLTADQTLIASPDDLTYTLGNLAALTANAGTYQLTIHADPNVTDFNGKNRLAEDASVSWNDSGPAVVARWAFYNNSAFDLTSAGPSPFDDDAIASDKVPLLPGQTASFLNYTSYTNGINGIMIDIARPPAGYVPAIGDFSFKVGNNSDPTTWNAPAPTPTSITAMSDPGLGGSERIEIIFADQAITNEWLQVTVNADSNTKLAATDVFYFGNAVGDTGNSPTDAAVNAADVLAARGRQSIFGSFIYNRWDFNRDGFIDNPDVLAARSNPTSAATMLQLITAPAAPPPQMAMSLQPATKLAAASALSSATAPSSGTTSRQAYRPASR